MLAKVAEIYALDLPTQTTTAKLRLRLLDLSGHVRNLCVWPPNCYSQLFQQDAVLKMYGITANMMYHSFSAGSDSVVDLDEDGDTYEFPTDIVSTKWQLTECPPADDPIQ